jgi:hypothetical protein
MFSAALQHIPTFYILFDVLVFFFIFEYFECSLHLSPQCGELCILNNGFLVKRKFGGKRDMEGKRKMD